MKFTALHINTMFSYEANLASYIIEEMKVLYLFKLFKAKFNSKLELSLYTLDSASMHFQTSFAPGFNHDNSKQST